MAAISDSGCAPGGGCRRRRVGSAAVQSPTREASRELTELIDAIAKDSGLTLADCARSLAR